jgi:hypothetical protein
MTTTSTAYERLTGWQGDADYFRFREHSELTGGPIVDVLQGRMLGVIFRSVIDPEASRQLVERFWASPARKLRGGEVCESQGYYVGAYHYHKPTEQYLRESAEVADYVDTLLDVPNEPSKMFRDVLREHLARDGVEFRPSAKDGRPSCPLLMRHWNYGGEFALQPHEDASQCREPKQADFEIQRALDYTVCAVNMCLENGDGGRLVMWNVVPDDESKTKLGLYYAGSPYPVEALDGIESVWLDVRPGDIYVFNGEHVHGVEASVDGAKRTTLAWNMGFCDDHTVVMWA